MRTALVRLLVVVSCMLMFMYCSRGCGRTANQLERFHASEPADYAGLAHLRVQRVPSQS